MIKLISENKIIIGEEEISFPSETIIDKIESFDSKICLNIKTSEKDLNWNDAETHDIWKKRCLNNPSGLLCYSFEGNLLWELADPDPAIYGFKKIGSDNDLELIEVHLTNYNILIDVNSGTKINKSPTK